MIFNVALHDGVDEHQQLVVVVNYSNKQQLHGSGICMDIPARHLHQIHGFSPLQISKNHELLKLHPTEPILEGEIVERVLHRHVFKHETGDF